MVLLFTLEYLLRFWAYSDSIRMVFKFVTCTLASIELVLFGLVVTM